MANQLQNKLYFYAQGAIIDFQVGLRAATHLNRIYNLLADAEQNGNKN